MAVQTGRLLGAALLLLPGCRGPLPAPAAGPLARLESAWQSLRDWDDQRRLLESLGQDTTAAGLPASAVADSLRAARSRFASRLGDSLAVRTAADSAALGVMLEEWRGGLAGTEADSPAPAFRDSSCTYQPAAYEHLPLGLEQLEARVLECYGRAANAIVIGHDTLNRLAILGEMAQASDSSRRRRLFLSLQPVWHSVNGDNGEASPYRMLLRLRRRAWGDTASPIERKAPAFGLTTPELEGWLTQALDAWRRALPDSLLEPWDVYYANGAASRRLSPRVPAIVDIRRVNDAFYRSIGADPAALAVHYDLAARRGKYPVAFTDFGARPRTAGGRHLPGEPWIFTSYLGGGFDNLAELLHESGHAIHIAAITTRPAFTDWPDNDTFTEALADLPALELYEPAWQVRFLGDSVPLADALRAKYAGIVFDMAWALFELRVHRDPDADPNAVWTEITERYLRIRPHPEWSWWAMRGQLIDGPGYLVNYALGAFLTADMRARAATLGHPFGGADARLYPWLSRELYRFGREVPARSVLRHFLSREVGPDALLNDLGRMRGTRSRR